MWRVKTANTKGGKGGGKIRAKGIEKGKRWRKGEENTKSATCKRVMEKQNYIRTFERQKILCSTKKHGNGSNGRKK